MRTILRASESRLGAAAGFLAAALYFGARFTERMPFFFALRFFLAMETSWVHECSARNHTPRAPRTRWPAHGGA
jgi:hypothetical protein